MSTLTDGLRLALDQLEAMIATFDTRHPMLAWRQHRVWRDVERELKKAGFSSCSAAEALEIYRQEREAARSELAMSAAIPDAQRTSHETPRGGTTCL